VEQDCFGAPGTGYGALQTEIHKPLLDSPDTGPMYQLNPYIIGPECW